MVESGERQMQDGGDEREGRDGQPLRDSAGHEISTLVIRTHVTESLCRSAADHSGTAC